MILLAPPLVRNRAAAVIVIAATMTLALVWVRALVHDHTAGDAILTGSATGVAAAIPSLLAADPDTTAIAIRCVATAIAASVAELHANDRLRGAFAAFGTSLAVSAIASLLRPASPVLLTLVLIVVVWTLVATAVRAPLLARELSEEAALGVIDEREIRGATHPVLRLLSRGWRNREARWRFVELANQLAIRKRRQKTLPTEMARLQQLDLMKLRMELAEVARVERSSQISRSETESNSADERSATI